MRSASRRRIASVLAAGLLAGLAAPVGARETYEAKLLPGLTKRQQKAAAEGRELFTKRWGVERGPYFNALSCHGCHRLPDIGGGERPYLRVVLFGRRENGTFDPLTELGGPMLHRLVAPYPKKKPLPDEANVISLRTAPRLFGLGLVDAVPDATFEAIAERNGGRIVRSESGRVHRFGSQNQVASLQGFVKSALENEIGVTEWENPFAVKSLTNFVASLAPVPRGEMSEKAARGEKLFEAIGCASCHVPSLRTAAGAYRTEDGEIRDVAALQGKEFHPYSDFLLHDMGPTLDDGVALGSARSSEYRTRPLWGHRFNVANNLHDGRAVDVYQSVLFHGGDAARSRSAFLALSLDEQAQIRFFLRSL